MMSGERTKCQVMCILHGLWESLFIESLFIDWEMYTFSSWTMHVYALH